MMLEISSSSSSCDCDASLPFSPPPSTPPTPTRMGKLCALCVAMWVSYLCIETGILLLPFPGEAPSIIIAEAARLGDFESHLSFSNTWLTHTHHTSRADPNKDCTSRRHEAHRAGGAGSGREVFCARRASESDGQAIIMKHTLCFRHAANASNQQHTSPAIFPLLTRSYIPSTCTYTGHASSRRRRPTSQRPASFPLLPLSHICSFITPLPSVHYTRENPQ